MLLVLCSICSSLQRHSKAYTEPFKMLKNMLVHDHFVLNTSALTYVFFIQQCISTNACIYIAFENTFN